MYYYMTDDGVKVTKKPYPEMGKRMNDMEVDNFHKSIILEIWSRGEANAFRVIFNYMKSFNLPQWYAPWGWCLKTVPCSRCGSDKIYSLELPDGKLEIVQCISAVRCYKSPSFTSMKAS